MNNNISDRLSGDRMEPDCSLNQIVMIFFVIGFTVFMNFIISLLFIKFYHLRKKVRKKFHIVIVIEFYLSSILKFYSYLYD